MNGAYRKISLAEWNMLTAMVHGIIKKNCDTSDEDVKKEVLNTCPGYDIRVINTAISASRDFLTAYTKHASAIQVFDYGDEDIEFIEKALFDCINRELYIKKSIIYAAFAKARSDLQTKAFELFGEIVNRRIGGKDRYIQAREMAGRIVVDEFGDNIKFNPKLFSILVAEVDRKQRNLRDFYNEKTRRSENRCCEMSIQT